MVGTKGNSGKYKRTEEQKRKMSISRKKWLKNNKHQCLGTKQTKEHIEKRVKSLCIPCSEEKKQKIGKANLRENASYFSKHIWIKKHYGKASKCENEDCSYDKPKAFSWANLTGNFRERKDYLQLCYSCHKKFDMGLIHLKIDGGLVKKELLEIK